MGSLTVFIHWLLSINLCCQAKIHCFLLQVNYESSFFRRVGATVIDVRIGLAVELTVGVTIGFLIGVAVGILRGCVVLVFMDVVARTNVAIRFLVGIYGSILMCVTVGSLWAYTILVIVDDIATILMSVTEGLLFQAGDVWVLLDVRWVYGPVDVTL